MDNGKLKLGSIRCEGQVQIGKSRVMLHLKEFLEGLGATVLMNDELKMAENLGENNVPLAEWEKEIISNTVWYLGEGGD